MRVLDLFSGIGGFSLGLQMAGGFETVQFVEIDPYCQKVLAKNFPGVPIHDDIRTFAGVPADLICGGFPCQDISVAGRGEGLSGERSGLWREFARIIGEVRPAWVIVENVSALLYRGIGDVLADLANLGYDAEWYCIPASAVGARHRRERVWIVSYPNPVNGEERMGAEQVRPRPRLRFDLPKCLPLWLQAPDPASGMADGIPPRVYIHRAEGLGNAVVPQVVAEIGRAIRGAQ